MTPLVSVCLPTRNRAAALRKSLETIQAQDYPSLEIIISDNSSDDDTERVCRELAARDARVRFTRQSRNIGVHANHNFCMDEARGEFLCIFHDHDDRSPRIVSECVAFMQAHPRVGVVSADWDLIDDNGTQLGVRAFDGPAITPGLEYITRTMRSGRSSIGTPGAMVRREALGSARFGPDAPIGFGDFPIWFRIAETWDIGHISKTLWSWRQNAVSHSARSIQDIARDFEKNLTEYCDDHLTRWPAHTGLVQQWRNSIKRYLFWALAYEVGLHFRRRDSREGSRTVFEIMDYRLTPTEFERALAQLKEHRTGTTEYAAFAAMRALINLQLTSPLGWVIRRQATVRTLLGLR